MARLHEPLGIPDLALAMLAGPAALIVPIVALLRLPIVLPPLLLPAPLNAL